jgi:peptidoglycan hydrolase-like protein with peptidoglycan-binding domain
VVTLQESLSALGYNSGAADGIFGPRTGAAVRAFQQDQGLSVDGIVGRQQTWPAMHGALIDRRDSLLRDADAIGIGTPVGQALLRDADKFEGLARQLETGRTGPSSTDPGTTNPPVNGANLHPADPAGLLNDPNMNPEFVRRVRNTINQLRAEGWDARAAPSGGFRSFEQQQALYNQGRTTPGNIVTNAEAGESWHNYGLATDIVLNNANGQPIWPDPSPFWQRLGEVAQENGLYWGGNFGDRPHVELHPGLRAGQAGTLIDEYNRGGLDEVWRTLGLN